MYSSSWLRDPLSDDFTNLPPPLMRPSWLLPEWSLDAILLPLLCSLYLLVFFPWCRFLPPFILIRLQGQGVGLGLWATTLSI